MRCVCVSAVVLQNLHTELDPGTPGTPGTAGARSRGSKQPMFECGEVLERPIDILIL